MFHSDEYIEFLRLITPDNQVSLNAKGCPCTGAGPPDGAPSSPGRAHPMCSRPRRAPRSPVGRRSAF